MNEDLQTAAREEIRDRLELTQQGKPANTAMNYKTVFQNDPLLKGAIRKNLLTERTDIVKPLGWYRESSTLTDVDGLRKKEAAVQLAQDFGLSYEDWKPPGKEKKPKPRQKSPEEQFQEAKNRCFRILADYLHLLRAWRTDYAPHSPEEAFHPRFIEALQKQDQVEYLLDVLLFGDTEEIASLITEHGKDVIQLEQRMAELAAADAARTKKHHERHAAAPER